MLCTVKPLTIVSLSMVFLQLFLPVMKNHSYEKVLKYTKHCSSKCGSTLSVAHNTWSWPTIFLQWLFLKKENCGMN